MSKQAVKTAVKAVLDATSDALDEIPASPYSCSAAQLKIRATLETIADQLGTTRAALASLRSRGGGPPYIKIGNTIAYPVVAFRVWALKQTGLGGTQ